MLHTRDWPDARKWIDQLHLSPHPEGGHFRQTYSASLVIPQTALRASFHGDRAASTAIYFLLEAHDFSALHRLASDEMWHFYAGDALLVHVIDEDGHHSVIRLGPNADRGEQFQAVVSAGCWFGSCLAKGGEYALVGCTVSPAFDFADFEMAKRDELVAQFPQHRDLIHQLTRGI